MGLGSFMRVKLECVWDVSFMEGWVGCNRNVSFIGVRILGMSEFMFLCGS